MYQISLAKFLNNKKFNSSFSKYEIDFDISKEDFLKKVVFLYEHLLYPLYYHHKEVIIKKFPFPTGNISISPLLLHTNREAIDIHLYLESWKFLFEGKESLCCTKKYVLEQLNQDQKKAVKKLWGPVCLIAPAGSGKTKTLVNRVLSLLNQGVSTKNVLVLVFNKKAELELKSRLPEIDVEVRTFHSFGNQLLKQYTDFEFYQEDPIEFQNTLLEDVISRHHTLSFGKNIDPLKVYREMLSKVKNELLSRDEMLIEINHKVIDFYPIFEDYMSLLKNEKLYDYDDMLYLAVCLLLQNGNLRNRIQQKYQYLLVDEFQDLNPVQLLLLKMIALPQNHLFVVGDDDQMIYGFRGSRAREMIDFKKTYHQATCLQLSINYRSKRKLVYHASSFINHNLERISKKIDAFSSDKGDVQVVVGTTFMDEVTALFSWVSAIPENKDVAILYRYQIYGLFLKFFFMMEGVIEYQEELSKKWYRMFLLFRFFFDEYNYSVVSEVAKLFKVVLPKKYYKTEEVLPFFDSVSSFSKVYYLLKERDISFRYFCLLLKVDCSFFFLEEEIEFDKLNLFFDHFISYFGGVKGFYEKFKNRKKGNVREIVFDTIHKTKGNEFDMVGYFHFEYPTQSSLLEEERRISYVAMTRAKSSLFITTDSIHYVRLFKEYFENNLFDGKTNLVLEEEVSKLTSELDSKKAKFFLLKKDQTQIKRKMQYEVQETVKTYYQNQQETFYQLKRKVHKLEKELFYYQEELWARQLFELVKCDIIGQGKKEDKYETFI